ncbi:MAG TPA: DUF3179 domain-containing (seleno)protein [Vicinamibacterales bacterium]|nr:DUF3179 domain-containing (seleno)protein [Vicinamibacterales bacterium]
MSRPPAVSSFTAPLVVLLTTSWLAASPGAQREPLLDWFFDAASADDRVADAALGRLRGAWRDAYAAMLLDLARFTQPRGESVTVDVSGVTPRRDPQGLTHMPVYPGAQFATIERRLHPSAKVRARLLQFLRQHTGQRFGDDLGRWRQWTWQLPYQPHAEYLAFKAQVSAGAVPMTAAYFTEGDAAIRLDEVDWTGRDPAHVPALAMPAMIASDAVRHVRDDHLVLGLSIDGEARAYPLRLVAPHQVVTDRVGGRDVLLAHCPLSGVSAAYDAQVDGEARRFAVSGLVYRSHSLLADRQTRQVWSGLTGEPVLNLAGPAGAPLRPLPIEVTTWREWRAAYPITVVMSADTGFPFTYAEGAFTPARLARLGLRFAVPVSSTALRPHASVIGVRPGPSGASVEKAVAIAVDTRVPDGVRHIESAGVPMVVIARGRRAAAVYEAPEARFVAREADGRLRDEHGRTWRVDADALVREDHPGERAARVPTVVASWSAWYARFPETELVK